MSGSNVIGSAEIQDWIVTYLAELLDVESEDVDVDIAFDRFGLDSSAAIGMTGELEEWLGKEIDATILYDYPTVKSLSKYLGDSLVSVS
ncbi:MAG: acyl carrier protein [Cyanobacteria bacterium P01_F01_bin.33]